MASKQIVYKRDDKMERMDPDFLNKPPEERPGKNKHPFYGNHLERARSMDSERTEKYLRDM